MKYEYVPKKTNKKIKIYKGLGKVSEHIKVWNARRQGENEKRKIIHDEAYKKEKERLMIERETKRGIEDARIGKGGRIIKSVEKIVTEMEKIAPPKGTKSSSSVKNFWGDMKLGDGIGNLSDAGFGLKSKNDGIGTLDDIGFNFKRKK